DLAERIQEASGVAAVTTSTAIIEALEAVGARSVLLVTPYIDEINTSEIEFLTASGFTVVDLLTFNLRRSEEIASVSSSVMRDKILAARQKAEQADAVFISCT